MLPLSRAQSDMIARLERQGAIWLRLSKGLKSGLDRAAQKYKGLEDQLVHLKNKAVDLHDSFSAYSRKRPSDEHWGPPVRNSPCVLGKLPGGNASAAVPLNPDRLVFEHAPTFDVEGLISDPLLKAGFMDPALLRIEEERWPKPRAARIQASRAGFLELLRKWDNVGSLHLLSEAESDFKYRSGVFAVFKNDRKDRQIINPVPENSRTFCPSEATKSLSHGSLLCGVHLRPDRNLCLSCSDLQDFYYCFKVTDRHAARNHMHTVFPAEQFEGWNAWRPELRGQRVVACFRSLPMGSNLAVEIAQHVHKNLLERAGALLPSQLVQYRAPVPRSAIL